MKRMRFHGMFRAFKSSLEDGKADNLTADEMVAQLIDAEWDERYNRSIDIKVKKAKFRYKAAIEDMYYSSDRNIDKNQVMRFTDCSFIKKAENILITGSTGIGKSYIATALGYHACSMGYRVAYHNVPKLFSKLKMAKADASYLREVGKIERQQLLILDDFGIQPFDQQSRSILMELIEDKYGKGSLIITSQIPVNKWYEVIGEQTVADAILDRVVHNAHRLELKGESLRKKQKLAEETTG
jgi:DNA replication protein DnaC